MDDLGKWGKASANHPANVAKPLVDRIVELPARSAEPEDTGLIL